MILLSILIALVAGIAPMLVYAGIVWWFDRYEKEPWPLLAAAFVWGAVPSIILALIFELVLDVPIKALVEPGLAYQLIGSSLVAPIVEEAVKGLAVWLVCLFFYRQFDGVLDGVVYGSLVGFGFAAVENVFYFLAMLSQSGAGAMFFLIFVRAFMFGLNHALFTSLTGIGLALARTTRGWLLKLLWPAAGLGLAVCAHALHNAGTAIASVTLCGPLVSVASDWGGVLVLFVIVLLAANQERQWIARYLADEVTSGLISPAQYRVACSYLERVAERLEALLQGQFGRYARLGRFHQLATRLAFRKYQLAMFGDEAGPGSAGGNRAEIDRLRRELARENARQIATMRRN
jgi:RsiW-degrading membrane proteinase PrsW (M82 family)